jgi:hypothetical protein
MNQYLLLRDNKQTGPYTAEQLKAKGLKAYDLVWHEGKSAAWRYPSELEELKPFAPVVEEQPYDRFYKKPANQATAQFDKNANNQVQEETVNSQLATQASAPITSGKVYVTMPVNKSITVQSNNSQQAAYSPNTTQSHHNNGKTTAAASYMISEEDDELNSHLLAGHQSKKADEAVTNDAFLSDYEQRKAAYQSAKSSADVQLQTIQHKQTATAVQNAAQQQHQAYSRKKDNDIKALLTSATGYLQNNKQVTRALVAMVLILGGVVIGLIINSGRGHSDAKMLENLVKEIREQQQEKSATPSSASSIAEQASKNDPNSASGPAVDQDAGNGNKPPAEAGTLPSTGATEQTTVVRHAIIKKDNNTLANSNKPVATPVSGHEQVDNTSSVTESPKEKISQEVLEKARKNIYEQVHVEASEFKVGLLGGISDLDITVANNSLYTLDQVYVEIKYYSMDKKMVKSQTLLFSNVPAGKKKTLEAPRTNRGVKIDYTVTNVNAKALGLAQTGY